MKRLIFLLLVTLALPVLGDWGITTGDRPHMGQVAQTNKLNVFTNGYLGIHGSGLGYAIIKNNQADGNIYTYSLPGTVSDTLVTLTNSQTLSTKTLLNAKISGSIEDFSGHVLIGTSSPTISTGFGTASSCSPCNNTAAFVVNVGTGGTASSGVISMPASNVGWSCMVSSTTSPQAGAETLSSPTSSTSITLTNYTLSTGLALAWASGQLLAVNCMGY